tara:strand:+ start:62 stop:343 length:282 start_codon:yes stop_codon:yes gene_type:complete
MNRDRISNALCQIRISIKDELDNNENEGFIDNYSKAIELCDSMLQRVNDTEIVFTSNSLLGTFKHFAIDSLPWSESLLKIIEEQQNIIEKECN